MKGTILHYLFCIIIISAIFLSAETAAQFAFGIGGQGNDFCRGVQTDDVGNIYTTGFFEGTVDFDPGPESALLTSNGIYGYQDIYVAKYDASGNYIWAFNIGDWADEQPYKISIDESGIYITGYFGIADGVYEMDFDPGPGTAILTATILDAFIAKYDTNGNYLWAFNISGPGSEVGYSIVPDLNGNFYALGYFGNEGGLPTDFNPGAGTAYLYSSGPTDAFVAKYDINGNYLWAFGMGTLGLDDSDGGAIDSQGNIVVTGTFGGPSTTLPTGGGSFDADPGPGEFIITSNGIHDIYIAKYNPNGDFLWAFGLGSENSDGGFGITSDNTGIYANGFYSGDTDFDPSGGTAMLTAASTTAYVVKYDLNGNYIWVFDIGSSSFAYGIDIIAKDSKVYVSGMFMEADFDPGPEIVSLTALLMDGYIAVYDQNKNYVWAEQIGGSGMDMAFSLSVDLENNCIVGGIFQDSMTVNFGSDSIKVIGMGGDGDGYLIKFDSNIVPVELTSFTANVIGNNVNLNWGTATETNNQGFEVERKVFNPQSTVGNSQWEKIGYVTGFGTTTEPKSYSFTDDKITTGKYSYRLKQVDFDGTFEYSNEIEVEISQPKEYSLEQNYPNPFNPSTTIGFVIPQASYVTLKVYNVLGQEVKTLINGFKDAGAHTIKFDAKELNSGMYIYKLEAGSYTQVRKMLLLK